MLYILAAAIRLKGKVWSLPRPARHFNVMQEIWKAQGGPVITGDQLQCDVTGYEDQGFLTSEEKFVDREEAAKIAIAAKQIEKLKWPPRLYSEDLW